MIDHPDYTLFFCRSGVVTLALKHAIDDAVAIDALVVAARDYTRKHVARSGVPVAVFFDASRSAFGAAHLTHMVRILVREREALVNLVDQLALLVPPSIGATAAAALCRAAFPASMGIALFTDADAARAWVAKAPQAAGAVGDERTGVEGGAACGPTEGLRQGARRHPHEEHAPQRQESPDAKKPLPLP